MKPAYFFLTALLFTQVFSAKADGLKINLENDNFTSSTELIYTPTSTTAYEKGLDRPFKKSPANHVNYIYTVAEAKHKLYVNYLQKPSAYTAIALEMDIHQEGICFFYLEDRTNETSNLSFSLTDDETGKTITIIPEEKAEMIFAAADVNRKKNFTLHIYPLIKTNASQVSCASSKNGNITVEFNAGSEWKAVLRNASSTIIQTEAGTKGKIYFENLGVGVYFVEIWVNDKLIREELTSISRPTGLQSKFTLSSDTITPGKRISTNNLSTGGNNWLWEFGDGSAMNGYDVSHVYANPEIYTVTLTTSNTAGCTSKASKTIHVKSVHPLFPAKPLTTH